MKSVEIRDNTGDTFTIQTYPDGVIETHSSSKMMLWNAEKVQALIDALKATQA